MHKKQMGSGRKSLVALMAIMGLMSGSAHSTYIPNNSQAVRAKDAINNMPQSPRVMEQHKGLLGANPYKHNKKGQRNQRQYRKWLKQVPQFRNSKKCRL